MGWERRRGATRTSSILSLCQSVRHVMLVRAHVGDAQSKKAEYSSPSLGVLLLNPSKPREKSIRPHLPQIRETCRPSRTTKVVCLPVCQPASLDNEQKESG